MLRGARPTERLPPPQERPAVLRGGPPSERLPPPQERPAVPCGAVALRASPAFRLRPRPSPRPARRVRRLASRRCLQRAERAAR